MLDRNFVDTIRMLNENKINYWLCHGTLLGIVRDKNLISWDNDIDIGVFDNTNLRRLIKFIMINNGFRLKKKFHIQDGLMTFCRSKFKDVDVNFYKKDQIKKKIYTVWYIPKNPFFKTIDFLSNSNLYCGKFYQIVNKYNLASNFFTKIKNYFIYINYFYKKAGYVHSENLIKNKIKINFKGLQVVIPKMYNKYLSTIYGRNWKTPVRDYNWIKDSPSSSFIN